MSKLPYGGYTQREGERVVGWGKVPPEYKHEESDNDDLQSQGDKSPRDKINHEE